MAGKRIMYVVKDEPKSEVWTNFSSGAYEVAGVETGAQAMSYYYHISQMSKAACK